MGVGLTCEHHVSKTEGATEVPTDMVLMPISTGHYMYMYMLRMYDVEFLSFSFHVWVLWSRLPRASAPCTMERKCKNTKGYVDIEMEAKCQKKGYCITQRKRSALGTLPVMVKERYGDSALLDRVVINS